MSIEWKAYDAEGRALSPPLGRIGAFAQPAFYGEADEKQRGGFDEADRGVERVAHGGWRVGETGGGAGGEAGLLERVERRPLAKDERERRPEDDDGAGDIAEDRLAATPERRRDQHPDRQRLRGHRGNPPPTEIVHRSRDSTT